jgi:hypothetical protein
MEKWKIVIKHNGNVATISKREKTIVEILQLQSLDREKEYTMGVLYV